MMTNDDNVESSLQSELFKLTRSFRFRRSATNGHSQTGVLPDS